jgi:hypothetical protein
MPRTAHVKTQRERPDCRIEQQRRKS